MSTAPDTVAAKASWTEQRERSNLWMLRLMRWISVALGRPVARVAVHLIATYFLLAGGQPVRESRRYLERVFGRPPTWRERYRHVHHFAATILDRVYLLLERFDLFDIQVTGTEHIEPMLEASTGALMIGAHMGSFEVMRALGQSHRGLKVAVVMYEDNARMINATLDAIAPNAELHTIALGRLDAMLTLQQWLDSGGVAGLLADRTLQGTGSAQQRAVSHRLPFLGASAHFSDGPFRLAALLRRQVVFMVGLYHGGNRYELRFLPLADFRNVGRGESRNEAIAQAQARYAQLLEGLCRETPFNWFNFFDFWADEARHRR
jgi:predicted LPLAT superfamily acyltransferase